VQVAAQTLVVEAVQEAQDFQVEQQVVVMQYQLEVL
jgi:hypothetical protein